MSKRLQKNLERSARKQEELEADAGVKVLMRFSENKIYNDLNKPIFYKGEVYELEGKAWIERWLKRGGEIVEKADGKVQDGAQPESESKDGLAAPLGEPPVVEKKEEGTGAEYMKDAKSLNNEEDKE